jgi:hypothetical protein
VNAKQGQRRGRGSRAASREPLGPRPPPSSCENVEVSYMSDMVRNNLLKKERNRQSVLNKDGGAHRLQHHGGLSDLRHELRTVLAPRRIPEEEEISVVLHKAARVVIVEHQHHRLHVSSPPRSASSSTASNSSSTPGPDTASAMASRGTANANAVSHRGALIVLHSSECRRPPPRSSTSRVSRTLTARG